MSGRALARLAGRIGARGRQPVARPSFEPGEPERRLGDVALYGRLLREARPYRLHIAALVAVSLLATPIALLMPVPLKIAVDTVVGSRPLPRILDAVVPDWMSASDAAVLALAACLVLLIGLLDQLEKLGTAVLGAYVAERLILAVRTRLFGHAQRLSLSYHDTKGTADSVYRIHSDAAAIQWISVYGVTPLASAAVTLLGMLFVTLRIDWQLALVALAITPLIFIATAVARRRMRTGWMTTKALESAAQSVVQEVLTGLRVVRAFGQEDRESARFATRSQAEMRARLRMGLTQATFQLAVGLATAAGGAIVLYVGVRHVQSGRLTLGELVLVMAYLAQLYVPIQAIGVSVTNLQSSLASVDRAFALLDEVPDVVERPDARRLTRARGEVTFDRVSFAYDGKVPVLDEVSFEVEPGTRVGIVGATGAGKTTLVSLLVRFFDPSDGRILLDGYDLREYRLADLRGQFAIVLQEPLLFSTSVAENIAYARPDADEDEIVRAAQVANADGFIRALPDGYDTIVGERGIRLSGGERQRISLARAFLKDAPILILDEPTSAVDVKTEAAIIEAMKRLMEGRTTFMIAHRLSTLANCGAHLKIQNGRVGSFASAPGGARAPEPTEPLRS